MKKGLLVCLFMLGIMGSLFSQKIIVTSPASGDTWRNKGRYHIRWRITGRQGAMVKIHLYGSRGKRNYFTITNATLNNGTYGPWTVPVRIPQGRYLVRVSTLDDKVKGDSIIFSISDPARSAGLKPADGPTPKPATKWPDGQKKDTRATQPVPLKGPGDPKREVGPESPAAKKKIYDEKTLFQKNNDGKATIGGIFGVQTEMSKPEIKVNYRNRKTVKKICPIITAVNIESGSAGTPVDIRGKNFGFSSGTRNVRIFGITSTNSFGLKIIRWDPTFIQGELIFSLSPGNYKLGIYDQQGKLISEEIHFKIQG